ncbi:glycosyltransferase family 61 protein [Alteromonas pelagimontana]|uniref:Glycosyltransferase family 61 protein n=1 Tax=Alteromonas pelagimontana TaxID=1858656 RepID=A0A6M4MCA5_9ALTE|nr:glycosyltransferase family 61 protein [Alteromonas pelagimontana]QJR80831.1 glycosyltransferase family 61 protein [Alteromonas pelagimontana]
MLETSFSPSARITTLQDALVYRQEKGSNPNCIRAGISHPNLPQWAHQWRGMGVNKAVRTLEIATDTGHLKEQKSPKKKLKGNFLYGGPLIIPFGHFLAESIHRCWAYEYITKTQKTGIDAVILQPGIQNRRWFHNRTYRSLPPYIRDTFNYLGIPEKKILLQYKNVIVENLAVPEQASYFRPIEPIKAPYLDFLSRCEKNSNVQTDENLPKKLYVSRQAFRYRGAFAGEAYIESFLSNKGYHILRPENHSLLDQLRFYKSADTIIFAEGGGIHMLELLGKLAANVYVINRRPLSPKVFKPILEDRVEKLSFFSKATTLPSLFLASDGRPAHGSAISVLAPKELNSFFEHIMESDVSDFDLKLFETQSCEDVLSYFNHYQKPNKRFPIQQQQAIKGFKEAAHKWL